MTETQQANQVVATNVDVEHENVSQSNPLCGVRGWLKFFVVVNMYISPVVFVLHYILIWIGVTMLVIGGTMLAKDYLSITFVALIVIETGVGGFLILKWIQIARRLRDIKPGVVQEAKSWLKISLGWVILGNLLAFMSGLGLETKDLLPDVIKSIVLGLISFAIWYSYFNVSKRVKATYSDWNQ